MAFKSYANKQPDRYITVGGTNKKGEKNPDSVTGYYLGAETRPSKFNPGKDETNLMLQVGKEVVQVKGNANLINKMKSEEANFLSQEGRTAQYANLRIECTGIATIKATGNTMKTFTVQFDADDTMPTASIIKLDAGLDDNEDADSLYADDTQGQVSTSSEDDDQEAELAALEAAATAKRKAQQAKMQALLSKSKKN